MKVDQFLFDRKLTLMVQFCELLSAVSNYFNLILLLLLETISGMELYLFLVRGGY
jgi:hypothetical protein